MSWHYSCSASQWKMNIRSITIAVATLVMSAVPGFAQDWTLLGSMNWDWSEDLYAHVDAGYLYQQDTTLNESVGSLPTATANASFSPGIRGDIALGYNINKSWAVEFDTGVLWNSMDKVNGVSLSSVDTSFDTYTVPLLVNINYKVPLKGPWFPYAGVGVGGAVSILSYSQAGYSWENSDFVFGYQAKAGLQYRLTQNASLDIAYEFFGTTDPNWNSVQNIGAPTDYDFKEHGFYTHSIVVSFTWRF